MDKEKTSREEDLYAFAAAFAASHGSSYKDTPYCRVKLVQMLEANKWFGMHYEFRGDGLYACPSAPFVEHLPLWMEAFGLAPVEKASLLLDRFQDAYPKTCDACRGYLEASCLLDSPAALMALDNLLCFVQEEGAELGEMADPQLHRLFETSASRLHRTAFMVLQGLVGAMAPSFMDRWEYVLSPYILTLQDETSAYPALTYTQLAWCVFNEGSWKTNSLIEKCTESASQARAWLFMAMHFVCGLRATDLCRLPAPVLEAADTAAYAGELLKSPERETQAAGLAQEWGRQLELTPQKPHKTQRFGGVPDLCLHIPKELEVPIGTILATALLHYDGTAPLMSGPLGVPQLRSLFGQEAVDLLDGHGFSTRRANKSYLQGISFAAGGDTFLGYKLAALARGHKGGYGTLAGTTDIYLRDASFAGYAPDYIAFQLFVRGPFSWVQVRFLEAINKKDYQALNVQGQTELISRIGLSPLIVESIWEACHGASAAARGQVVPLLRRRGALKEAFHDILDGMAESTGPAGRCLSRAAGGCCRIQGRPSCHFCPYDLLAPALVGEVMKEYVLLSEKALSLEEGPEKERVNALLSQGLMPVLAGLRDLAKTEGKDAPSLLCIMREAALLVRRLKQEKDEKEKGE